MKLRERRSILGIDPTKRGLTFVFFERGELMDWTSRICGSEAQDGLDLLDTLIDGCAADILVLEDPEAEGCMRRPRLRQFLRAAIVHGRRRGIRVIPVSRRSVRREWSRRGRTTKQTIAASVAQAFPELAHLVPLPRKVFMDEDDRLQIFDALTLVLAAFDRSFSVGR